jgi:hypothetical protein
MIEGLKQAGIAVMTPVMVVLTAVFMPILIWVAAIINIRMALAGRRASRRLSAAEAIACRIDTDCPSGYRCLDGRCFPVLADQ